MIYLNLVSFSSECGEWKWRCIPRGISVSAQFFSAWLTRVYRKYPIVIGQTKILPVIQEKRQNAIENIFSIARELRNSAATVAQEPQLFQLDKIEANQAPTTVSAEEMAVI